MATSDFSWTKILCIIGAGLCFILSCVILAAGIYLVWKGGDYAFNGWATIIGAVATFGWALALYKFYQKWNYEGNYEGNAKKEDE